MRSKTIIVITVVSLVLLIYALFEGIEIGNIKVLSIKQIIEKNNSLSAKIEEASELTTTKYHNSLKELQQTFKEYKIQKQKYEELSGVTGEVNEEVFETKQYDIVYLWKVLGSYAKKRNVTLEISVQKNTRVTNSYDINFKVSGTYVAISQFIIDIENDSDLYFRIYNFNMTGNSSVINSSFSVRNVNIDPSTITQATRIPESDY